MTEVDGSLILEHLKRLQDRMSRMEQAILNVATEIRGLKQREIANLSSEVSQDNQIADLAVRIDRIERRLDIREG
jgi:hypothetical protein